MGAGAQSFQNGQSANGVVGKPNFTSNTPTTPTSTNTGVVEAAIVDPVSGKVFVVDKENHRILRWASVTAAINGQPADAVFGQSNFTAGSLNAGAARSAVTLAAPSGIFVDANGALWVADTSNNRVLRFDAATQDPFTLGTRTANLVLGQSSFTGGDSGSGAAQLHFPRHVVVDRLGAVWVADRGNNRVVRFNAASLTNGGSANIVLGQPGFGMSGGDTGQGRMNAPTALAVDASDRLWVADSGNHRVLRFDGAVSFASSGIGASGVLGQGNFSDSGLVGLSGLSFNEPSGVAISAGGRLFVSDSLRHRVLWFDNAASKANGGPADGVLGQSAFNTQAPATTATGLRNPEKVFLDGSGNLWVADSFNRRAVRFIQMLPAPAPAPFPLPPLTPSPPSETPPESPRPPESSLGPEISIAGPRTVRTSRNRVVVRGTASAAAGLSSVQLRAGSARFRKARGMATWRAPVRLPRDAKRLVVRARAVDSLGATSPFARVRIIRRQ